MGWLIDQKKKLSLFILVIELSLFLNQKMLFYPSPLSSLLDLRPNNEATSKPYASPIRVLVRCAQDVHGWGWVWN